MFPNPTFTVCNMRIKVLIRNKMYLIRTFVVDLLSPQHSKRPPC